MHGHAPTEGCEGIFTIDAAHLTFGGGCLSEVGALAQSLGGKRVAVFTDERVAALPFAATLLTSLEVSRNRRGALHPYPRGTQ